MPGAETIVKTILDDAKAAAAQTLRSAQERTELLHSQAAQRQKEAQAQAERRIQEEIVQQTARARRMAELEARKAELADKRALIDEAFAGALDQLCAMDPDKKRALNRAGALEAAKGGETFRPAQADAQLLNEAFLKEVNAQMGDRSPLRMGPAVPGLRGGFLLEGQGVVYNCSYEALVNQVRDGLEAEVAAQLFGPRAE